MQITECGKRSSKITDLEIQLEKEGIERKIPLNTLE
jgi:hypothetical protein